ncbi:MAG: polysaccharide deacetylase family protein [Myxococcales bacterium]|nr:polysaccharide deacetylase family protein [Myxococcales bacterium]
MYSPRMQPLVPIVGACAALACGAAACTLAGWASVAVGLAGAGLGGVTLVTTLVAASAWPQTQLFGPAPLRGSAAGVALTFDDGPDPESTPQLLQALEEAGATATFFVLADRVEAHPELARAIAEKHEVALHGASHHPWLTVFSPKRGAAELREAWERVARVTGVEPSSWFRPPFGATSPRLFASAEGAGLQVVWCSVRTGDGGPIGPDTLRRRCQRAQAGDIVLLHEGPRAAREALPQVLADLEARGLPAVTVSEMLA